MLSDKAKSKNEIHKVQEWMRDKHTKNRLAEMIQMDDSGKQVEYM